MPSRSGRFKLIKAARLVDGRGGPVVEAASVLVRDSKIVQAGPQHEIHPPEGAEAETFEYPDSTIMPGMVDCHTHHNGFGDGRLGDTLAELPDEVLTLQSARNARTALFSGVTSIRENGPKNDTMFRLRDAVRQGLAVGPRMVLCGPPVAIIGGHMGYFGGEVTGPNEVRAMTRRLIRDGADYIKITATGGSTLTSSPLLPSFDVDELRAITSEARNLGKLTASHCLSTEGIARSLDAGVDMIIHCVFREPDGSYRFREDLAERIGRQGAYVNPTLHVFRSLAWALESKKERRGLTPQEQAQQDSYLWMLETGLEHCRRLIQMGLKVITGSDSSWGEYKLGNTPHEVQCLAMAGYTPMQAVTSVTGEAAAALGIDRDVGTIEAGKEADIVVVDGNPAVDVEDLWNVAEVFQAGRLVDRGSAESRTSTRQLPPDGTPDAV